MDLKAYLAAHAIKQSDFAVAVDTTPATISRILKGTFRPGLDLAVRIEQKTRGKVPASIWTREAA